jgi:Polysaccharide biosynthesis protein
MTDHLRHPIGAQRGLPLCPPFPLRQGTERRLANATGTADAPVESTRQKEAGVPMTSESSDRIKPMGDGSDPFVTEPPDAAAANEFAAEVADDVAALNSQRTGSGEIGESVRKKVVRSLVWSLTGFGTIQIVRFGFNVLLNWYLAPADAGLMTLVDLFIIGLTMFSDLGVGLSIVRSERGDDPQYLNTAWSVQVVRGFMLWFGACTLAWPVAYFSSTPVLFYLLPVAALTTIGNGFNSIAIYTCERRLDRGRLEMLKTGSHLIGLAVIVACLVLTNLSVWSLIIGRLTGSVLEMIGSHCLLPGPRCCFAWDRTVVSEILHFGKWIFVSTGCTFLADQADRLIILATGNRLIVGAITSLALLGVYNVAVQLAMAAKQVVQMIASSVVFPYYSRMNQQGPSLGRGFRGFRHRRTGQYRTGFRPLPVQTGPRGRRMDAAAGSTDCLDCHAREILGIGPPGARPSLEPGAGHGLETSRHAVVRLGRLLASGLRRPARGIHCGGIAALYCHPGGTARREVACATLRPDPHGGHRSDMVADNAGRQPCRRSQPIADSVDRRSVDRDRPLAGTRSDWPLVVASPG